MLELKLTEEQQMLREMVKDFTNNEIKPIAAKIDSEAKIPEDLIKKMAELGFLGISFPEEYGGGGMGEVGYCLMQEEIARGCMSTATFIGANQSIGSNAIYLGGSEEQKKKYVAMRRGDVDRAREDFAQLAEQAEAQRKFAVLAEGLEDSLQFYGFPAMDPRKISSTNVLERLNKEIRRRSRVVGVFPSEDSYVRLLCCYLIEYTEDWEHEKRYIRKEAIDQLRVRREEAA